jgi:hypothetical protein
MKKTEDIVINITDTSVRDTHLGNNIQYWAKMNNSDFGLKLLVKLFITQEIQERYLFETMEIQLELFLLKSHFKVCYGLNAGIYNLSYLDLKQTLILNNYRVMKFRTDWLSEHKMAVFKSLQDKKISFVPLNAEVFVKSDSKIFDRNGDVWNKDIEISES